MIICIFRILYFTNLSDRKVEKKEFRQSDNIYIQKAHIYRHDSKGIDKTWFFFVKKF